MPEPPRPKRFQIHLSTAIVMMFVAGALMWANAPGRRYDSVPGWPFPVEKTGNGPFDEIARGVMGMPEFIYSRLFEISIVLDAMIGLSILFAVWFICERLIRRRAARKAP